MNTILEYATLAGHVYNPEAPLFKVNPGLFVINVNKGINLLHGDGWYIINNIDNLMTPSQTFFAQLYVKFVQGQALSSVIAIRGTHNLPNAVQDVKSWWKSFFNSEAEVNLPRHYVSLAAQFFYKTYDYLTHTLNIPGISQFVTGHSLGGAIAALLPTHQKLPVRAVTFDAPGICHIQGVDNYPHRVINVRATFDFVSALDYPIGPVWNCNIPEAMAAARRAFIIGAQHKRDGWSRLDIVNDIIETDDFLRSVVPQHGIKNLISAMRKTQAAAVTKQEAASEHLVYLPTPATALPGVTYSNFNYNLETSTVLEEHQLHSPFCVDVADKIAYQG